MTGQAIRKWGNVALVVAAIVAQCVSVWVLRDSVQELRAARAGADAVAAPPAFGGRVRRAALYRAGLVDGSGSDRVVSLELTDLRGARVDALLTEPQAGALGFQLGEVVRGADVGCAGDFLSVSNRDVLCDGGLGAWKGYGTNQ